MNIAASRNMGAFIKSMLGLSPLDNSDGARNGVAIDRSGYLSCSLAALVGASTGAPSAISITYKVQDSADGTTDWVDLADSGTVEVTANNSAGKVDVDLSNARKFIRVVETTAHTGGTSPTTLASCAVVLGGADSLPAA